MRQVSDAIKSYLSSLGTSAAAADNGCQNQSGRDLKKIRKLSNAADLDSRLKPGSAAIDHGVILPNITDGFAGSAPDLGALEFGQPPTHYGPRPMTQ